MSGRAARKAVPARHCLGFGGRCTGAGWSWWCVVEACWGGTLARGGWGGVRGGKVDNAGKTGASCGFLVRCGEWCVYNENTLTLGAT